MANANRLIGFPWHALQKVEPRQRQTILPPDLFERYAKLAFWRDMPTSKVFRIVAKAEGTQQQAVPQPTQKLDTTQTLR